MPTKSPTLDERSNVPAKETKPNSSSPHPTHPIVSEISPDDKTGSDAPVEGSQQPDHEMADGPSTQVEHTGNATFKTEVDNPNLIIPMRDGCAPPGQGSDDDEVGWIPRPSEVLQLIQISPQASARKFS